MKGVGELSQVARLIDRRVYELGGKKSQRDIASEAGFKNQNIITMLKQGDCKLALDRVPALAKALETDPAQLFKLALEQFYSGEVLELINGLMGFTISDNEKAIVNFIRDTSNGSNPGLNDKLRNAIKDGIAE